MTNVTIQKVMAQQAQERQAVLDNNTRGTSAHTLAQVALEQHGSGAVCAAKLLLSMEYSEKFDFELLLSLDTKNRAHADLVMLGYKSHELWPSKWMEEEGFNGREIMAAVRQKLA